MNSRKNHIRTIGATALSVALFLIGTQSYFNNKEINNARDKCYEIRGTPQVESDFLKLNYTFTCSEKN